MSTLSIPIIFLLGSLLRLGMLLDITGPAVLSKYTQSAAIRSILYDPKYTLEHLKEINFVSNYFSGNESNKSNPLVFITVQKIMAHTPVGFDHELAFCMLAMLLDLAIACQLYRLAKEYYATKTDHMKWEIATEKNMNPLIYPISQNRMHLFGSHFDDIDKDLSPLFATSNIPSLSATIYYLNPITVLTSSGGNVQGIWILLLVSSLLEAVKGNATLSGIYLAVLCHVDIFNIVFLIPSALLWKNYYEFESKELKGRRPSSILYFVSFLFSFLAVNIAALTVQGFNFVDLKQLYNTTHNFEDLTPNLGMAWYLFINTFTRYREYFMILCSGFIFIFCAPLLLRFSNYPFEMVTMFQLLRAIFNPRPTLQDVSFAFALAALARRTIARMGNASVVSMMALPVPVILYVVDYWLWLQSGSGNANYMFFQCLAYNLFLGILTLDFISSTLKRDKAICLTDKKPKECIEDKGN